MKVTRRDFLRLSGMGILSTCIPGNALGGLRKIPVLMYHDISDSFSDDYTISPSLFAAQMEWLHGSGYRAISLRDVHSLEENEKAVVITFDDGYASYMDYAFPLFREYGFHSLINVIGSRVGGVLHAGGNRPTLSWDEYRYLLGHGLLDIGCHTHDLHSFAHRGALDVPARRLKEDLHAFLKTLQRETGASTDILAWPYGLFNEKGISTARNAGFRYILTSKDEIFAVSGDYSSIPRRTITNHFDLVSFRLVAGE